MSANEIKAPIEIDWDLSRETENEQEAEQYDPWLVRFRQTSKRQESQCEKKFREAREQEEKDNAFQKSLLREKVILSHIPRDFCGALNYCIEEAGERRGYKITQTELAKETGIHKGTIHKYISGSDRPKLGAVVLLCAALNLSYRVSIELIHRAGYNFTRPSEENCWYWDILTYMNTMSVREVRETLSLWGAPDDIIPGKSTRSAS